MTDSTKATYDEIMLAFFSDPKSLVRHIETAMENKETVQGSHIKLLASLVGKPLVSGGRTPQILDDLKYNPRAFTNLPEIIGRAKRAYDM